MANRYKVPNLNVNYFLCGQGCARNEAAEEIAVEVGVTKRTIERTLVSLKKKGKIERLGSNKRGSWAVIQ